MNLRAPQMKTTQEAIAHGLTLVTVEQQAGLLIELAATRAEFADAERAGDIEAMIQMSFRSQMLREALEAATGTGGVGRLLRRMTNDGMTKVEMEAVA